MRAGAPKRTWDGVDSAGVAVAALLVAMGRFGYTQRAVVSAEAGKREGGVWDAHPPRAVVLCFAWA